MKHLVSKKEVKLDIECLGMGEEWWELHNEISTIIECLRPEWEEPNGMDATGLWYVQQNADIGLLPEYASVHPCCEETGEQYHKVFYYKDFETTKELAEALIEFIENTLVHGKYTGKDIITWEYYFK